jgi:hypothetical protein
MQIKSKTVRGEASMKVLSKWITISALWHVLLISSLCGFSYWKHDQNEKAALAAKAELEADQKKKAEAKKIEDEKAAALKAANNPKKPDADKVKDPSKVPGAEELSPEQKGAKILGIDKTAPTEDVSKSPGNGIDDLLKDLK